MKIKTVENNKLKKHSLDMIAIADRIEEATSESDFFFTILDRVSSLAASRILNSSRTTSSKAAASSFCFFSMSNVISPLTAGRLLRSSRISDRFPLKNSSWVLVISLDSTPYLSPIISMSSFSRVSMRKGDSYKMMVLSSPSSAWIWLRRFPSFLDKNPINSLYGKG